MAARTCKPDAELKLLWQKLLPGTPMPSCGTETAKADAAETPAPPPRDADRPQRDKSQR
jgi:hypothetical protein